MTVLKTPEKQRIAVFSIGSMALGCLSSEKEWQVIATFKKCLYCRDNQGNIICIGRAEIGKGPFTLLCSLESPWPELVLSTTSQIMLRENQLLLEGTGIIFDLQGALVWNKSLRTLGGQSDCLLTDIRWIAGKACRDAPSESLGPVVPSFFPLNGQPMKWSSSLLTKSLHRCFVEVISEVRHSSLLLSGNRYDSSRAETLGRLIGLGPGLTPAGDDFLAGIVMGLFKMGHQHEATQLAHYFCRAASGRVTAISLAFYRALSEGFVVESYHQLLDAIGTGDHGNLERLLKQVSLFGATSGWDTITGILFGFSLALADRTENRNRAEEVVC